MGFFKKKFGFRWSLYITKDGKHLMYALHENSVIGLVGYVMRRFANGKVPVEPWSLYLNFNHTHQNIKLGSEHFTQDGENVTPLLIQQIESIDPGFQVKFHEPVFVEVASGKQLRISNYTSAKTPADMRADIEQRLANIDKPKELTFFDVIDQVFSG